MSLYICFSVDAVDPASLTPTHFGVELDPEHPFKFCQDEDELDGKGDTFISCCGILSVH